MYLSGTLVAMLLPLLFGTQAGCVPVENQNHHVEAPIQLHTQTQTQTETQIKPGFGTALAPAEPEPEPESEFFPEAEDDAMSSLLIPSRYESTVLGRRLLALSKTGVLTTVFPSNITSPRIPSDVADTPIGLPDYVASCEEPSGNPTLLALTISTSTKNAFAGSNVSLALSWWDEYVHLTHKQPWSAANLPRLSMIGYLEEMSEDDIKNKDIPGCFTKVHGDSVLWLPGKKWAAHEGLWMRLVVREVYWIGGFGDRNFIGWFDREEWENVKEEEWMEVRLPGEK
ncbi:uncharacterized protein Z518_01487 [Rhinocladiella mackenziei CBS 650.93]|uniref:Rhinocladiella mackenziei CBS 650.93 unplaced genomic scaffold supercont1.1, whole genome shotgun sequence n=1 Tax=Rhinocladiella mackenziei CBS 650.93 TaxID=1442369 RepID=A0A0D2JLQ2_9EURO|nr:uncharacterized protein Z518_01487 [Rhinocladiella mackenziei CBS 650.93]KIX10405.1 hypothetical protein Z518_01487 [Rhinocladiella mackenziei CBS 650.93]